MKRSKGFLFFIFGWLFVSGASFSQEASIAEQQADAVRELMIAMNQSSNEIGQQIFTAPQRASDAGCLDGIMSIDLSVFRVDFTSAWSAILGQVKDAILNTTCSAASDWANDQTAALETSMEAPYGLGSISISQGTAIDDWQSVTRESVALSAAELANKVTTGTLGQVPDRTIPSQSPNAIESSQDTPSSDKESMESELPRSFNFRELWRDPS